jgi:hypothetical protein
MNEELIDLNLNNIVNHEDLEFINSSILYLIQRMEDNFYPTENITYIENNEEIELDSDLLVYSNSLSSSNVKEISLLNSESTSKDIFYILCDSGRSKAILSSSNLILEGDISQSINITIYRLWKKSSQEYIVLDKQEDMWIRNNEADFYLEDFDGKDFLL